MNGGSGKVVVDDSGTAVLVLNALPAAPPERPIRRG